MSINQLVDQKLQAAMSDLSPDAFSVISTRPNIDRQYNGLMAIAKTNNIDAMELAQTIVTRLDADPLFDQVTVSKPGFINLRLSDTAILENVGTSILADKSKRIIIDFGGPNLAKSLHVGHLRSLVIGESLRRILIARGHKVVSDIHFGDWGLPIGMLVATIIHDYPNFPTTIPDNFGKLLEKIYPEAVTDCRNSIERLTEARVVTANLQDGELTWIWQAIRNESLAVILPQIKRLGAHFDLLYGESNAQPFTHDVQKLLNSRVRNENGTLLIDVAKPDDTKTVPPIIFQKADGGYTYAATDLATLLQRQHHDQILYVVDKRQSLHFEQIFRAKQFLPFARKIDMVHVGFGTVNGIDGKPFKTRDGNVPTLGSMLDGAITKAKERIDDPKTAEMVGIGAVKFADLVTHRESGYVFDLDRITSLEGKTGPYVQYACVRLKKILDRADINRGPIVISHPAERDLLLACANFPETIGLAEKHLLPNYIAEYAFTLAQCVSRFYDHCDVLKAELPLRVSRLAICQITYEILVKCLDVLGIGVPTRM